MISNVITSYSAVCKFFNFAKIKSSCIRNKNLLFSMAKKGRKKPNIRSKMGSRLYSYTYKRSTCYDEKFTKKLMKIRPDWFLSQYDIAKQKKDKLIEMAKKGEPRPNKKTHPLGAILSSYTNKSQGLSYDEKFTIKIKKIRPDWFVSQVQVANQKKKKLLDMAKAGKPRPKYETKLGKFLGERTTKKEYLDSEFSKKIKKLRPDWFVTNADKTKKYLIEMAKNGQKRPNQKSKLGMLLYSYKRRAKNNDFINILKKIRPDWFVSRSEIVSIKKQQLLVIAKSGLPRPYGPNLGCLCNYVSKGSGSYDPEFSKKIRKIRPDWFRNEKK